MSDVDLQNVLGRTEKSPQVLMEVNSSPTVDSYYVTGGALYPGRAEWVEVSTSATLAERAAAIESKLGSPERLWTPDLDLDEKIWLDWNHEDLADGSVASWVDARGSVNAAQSTGANRPTKDSTGVVFSGGTKNLVIPNLTQPERRHRGFVCLFKAGVATATATGGVLVAINGTSGSAPHRVPALEYSRTNSTYIAHWSPVDTFAGGAVVPKGTDSLWHVVVSRRVNGRTFTSIDGGTEVPSTGTNIVLRRDNTSATGLIGDSQATTINWTLKRFMVLQGELTDDEVDRISGWALWSMGQQASLPSDHPYRNVPPKGAPFVNDVVGLRAIDWEDINHYWSTLLLADGLEKHYGEDIAPLIEGFTEVFKDDFATDTVVDDETGAVAAQNTAQWFAPVQDDVGGDATPARLGASPACYAHGTSEYTITMRETVEGNGTWRGGNIVSVNRDGRGNTWNPAEHPTYFEARMKSSPGNGEVSTWFAMWLKDVQEFTYRTTTRVEVDIVEAYNGDNDGHHQSHHSWPADRELPGRLADHKFDSNFTRLDGDSPWGATDLFDDEYHTYGCLVDQEWTIFTFDGLELAREPTRSDMLRPLYLLFSLAMHDEELAEGTYTLTFDWIRVLQDLR